MKCLITKALHELAYDRSAENDPKRRVFRDHEPESGKVALGRANAYHVDALHYACSIPRQSRPGLRPDESVRNMTSQPLLDRLSAPPPCKAYVSGQSRPRASADDSVRNMTVQPPLAHPSEPPAGRVFQGRTKGFLMRSGKFCTP